MSEPNRVEDGSVRSSIGCLYCNGVRDPFCKCETDCGARRGEFYGADCPKRDRPSAPAHEALRDALRRGERP